MGTVWGEGTLAPRERAHSARNELALTSTLPRRPFKGHAKEIHIEVVNCGERRKRFDQSI